MANDVESEVGGNQYFRQYYLTPFNIIQQDGRTCVTC